MSTGRSNSYPLGERPDDRAEAEQTGEPPDVAEDVTRPDIPVIDPDPQPANVPPPTSPNIGAGWGTEPTADGAGWGAEPPAAPVKGWPEEPPAVADEGWHEEPPAIPDEQPVEPSAPFDGRQFELPYPYLDEPPAEPPYPYFAEPPAGPPYPYLDEPPAESPPAYPDDDWAEGPSAAEQATAEPSPRFDGGWAAQPEVAAEATYPRLPVPAPDRYYPGTVIATAPPAADWGAYSPPGEVDIPAPPDAGGPRWAPLSGPRTIVDAPPPAPPARARRRRLRIDLLPFATLVVALFWLWVLLFRLTGGTPVGAAPGSTHRIVWAIPTLAPTATATATPHPLTTAVLSAFGGGDSATQQCPAPGTPAASQPLPSLGVYIDNTRSNVPVYWWVDIHDPLPGPGTPTIWASASDPFGTLPAGKATWATVYPVPNLCQALQTAGITTPTAFHAYVGVGGFGTSMMTDTITPPLAATPTPAATSTPSETAHP